MMINHGTENATT